MPIWGDGTLEYPIHNERRLASRRAVARGGAQRARRDETQRRRDPPWMELKNKGRRHRSDLSKTRREGENESGFPFSPSEIVEKVDNLEFTRTDRWKSFLKAFVKCFQSIEYSCPYLRLFMIPLSNMRANVKSGRDFNIGGRMFESFHHSAFRRFQRFPLSLN